jgi:bidirectional [NiFe] hydrogenase diaphorase subunit
LRRAGVLVPTLCEHPGLEGVGSCRLCLVEVNTGRRSQLVASCLYPVEGELTVLTDSPRVNEARRFVLTLLLARYSDVQLIEELARRYGVKPVERLQAEPADCLLCLRCVRACAAQGNGAIATCLRGREKRVSPPFDEPPADCVGCGACAEVCPLGAIKVEEGEGKRRIWGREFTLVHCQSCGEPFATREQFDYLRKQPPDLLVEEELCPRCRKLDQALRISGSTT